MPTNQTSYIGNVEQIARMEARSFWYMGNRVKIHADRKDTNGQFSLLEWVQKPGTEPPLHCHENEDEMFLVLEGELAVTCGGMETILRAGDSAVARRGVPHTFQIRTPMARTIVVFTPAGFEDFFRTLGQPIEDGAADQPPAAPAFARIAQAAAQFGSRLLR